MPRNARDDDPYEALKKLLGQCLNGDDFRRASELINQLGGGSAMDDLRPEGTPEPSYLGAQDRRYAMDGHPSAGRAVADRECALAECSTVVPRDLLMAQDSAENVFRAALGEFGIDHLLLPAAALPAMFRTVRRAQSGGRTPYRTAMDSAGVASFNKRFPEAARIRSV